MSRLCPVVFAGKRVWMAQNRSLGSHNGGALSWISCVHLAFFAQPLEGILINLNEN